MEVNIHKESGFCFGVERATKKAEEYLEKNEYLYSLGDIVHNEKEVNRLSTLGLRSLPTEVSFDEVDSEIILVRAHGEPPETYEKAKQQNKTLLDATCPVVLKLQARIRKAYEQMEAENGQVVIYGKKGHAEVRGLLGQTDGNAILIQGEEDFSLIDFSRPVVLFTQTTMSLTTFHELAKKIEENCENTFKLNDTICRQVSNREPKIYDFCQENEVIIFVSGKKSSNGKALFQVCQKSNPRSYIISGKEELDPSWWKGAKSIGITGATSTPYWLMEQIALAVQEG